MLVYGHKDGYLGMDVLSMGMDVLSMSCLVYVVLSMCILSMQIGP
jgi:hypothetical protein